MRYITCTCTDLELTSSISATPKLNEPLAEGQRRLSLVPSSAILSSAPGHPVQGMLFRIDWHDQINCKIDLLVILLKESKQ